MWAYRIAFDTRKDLFSLCCVASDASVPAARCGLPNVSELKIKKEGPLNSKRVEHQKKKAHWLEYGEASLFLAGDSA